MKKLVVHGRKTQRGLGFTPIPNLSLFSQKISGMVSAHIPCKITRNATNTSNPMITAVNGSMFLPPLINSHSHRGVVGKWRYNMPNYLILNTALGEVLSNHLVQQIFSCFKKFYGSARSPCNLSGFTRNKGKITSFKRAVLNYSPFHVLSHTGKKSIALWRSWVSRTLTSFAQLFRVIRPGDLQLDPKRITFGCWKWGVVDYQPNRDVVYNRIYRPSFLGKTVLDRVLPVFEVFSK